MMLFLHFLLLYVSLTKCTSLFFLFFTCSSLLLVSFQVECLVCHYYVYPGEEVVCSVRGCQGVYHGKCVKEKLRISNMKKFKCQQHVRSEKNNHTVGSTYLFILFCAMLFCFLHVKSAKSNSTINLCQRLGERGCSYLVLREYCGHSVLH